MYDLLSTTRTDPYLVRLAWNNHDGEPTPYLLLQFHCDRLRDAAAEHGWPDAQSAVSYAALHEACQAAVASYDGDPATAYKVRPRSHRSHPLKRSPQIRITLSQAGLLKASAATLYGPAMTLFLDTEPTPPSGLFTSTKTTERTVYNAARARVGLPPLPSPDADVILYNPNEHITETSVSNVAFYRSHRWVTPPLSSGCLPGVTRRWLLQHKRIVEAAPGELVKAGMRPGDWVLLFNSVQGCRLGRIIAS
ncbi:aminotransferase [Mycena galopus ATCC 62051]|nr:aminotransferase [Mycena galopus ATCC 62051]